MHAWPWAPGNGEQGPYHPLPGDIAASRRYFKPDLIDPEIDVASDGTIAVPTGPGIGVNVVWDRVAAATLEQTELRAWLDTGSDGGEDVTPSL